MRRAALRTALTSAAITALALAAASCGGDGDGPSTDDVGGAKAPAAAPSDAPSAPRAAGPAVPPAPIDVDALLAAWTAAADDAGARRRAQEALVAGGAPVLERLIAWLSDPNDQSDDPPSARRTALRDLIRAFGDAAVGPLVGLLDAPDQSVRHTAMDLLWTMSASWAFHPRGETVCRALLARIEVEGDGALALRVLRSSRPAGRCIAEQLARLWSTAGEDRAEELGYVLVNLGPDAAPAAPIVFAAWKAAAAPAGTDVPPRMYEILSAIGSANPSILGDLRAEIADGPPGNRQALVELLAGWGDAAAAAAPDLVALLRDPDENLRESAATTLSAMPAAAKDAWRPILDAFSTEDGSSSEAHAEEALKAFARDPGVAAEIAAALPTLPVWQMDTAFQALHESGAFDMTPLVPILLRHPDAQARMLALWPWAIDAEFPHPLPDAALALLDDPDPGVRAYAAAVFADLGAAPAARIVEVALALVGAEEPWNRRSAISALGVFAASDERAFDAVVAALDDADVHEEALRALARGDTPVPGKHPVAIAWAVEQATEWYEGGAITRALLRLDGGAAALCSALPAVLEASVDYHLNEFDRAMYVVALAGPRAAALRPVLVRLREKASVGQQREIDRALAAIDQDPVAIAATSEFDEDTARRLLAFGDVGRRAIVLLAGGTWATDDLPEWLRTLSLDEEIVAAAHTRPPDANYDGHYERRRIGAAGLAPLLPPDRALALLAELADDPSDDVRSAVVSAFDRIEERTPGTVPAALVLPLIADGSERIRYWAYKLAGRLGTHGADLVPALRTVRDDVDSGWSSNAAVALWQITRRADEALPTLRALLVRPEDTQIHVNWDGVAAALAELPLTADDIPALVRSIRDTRGDDALIPLLAQFGPAAAPAVPVLRNLLADPPDYPDETGPAIARVLAAIGPAAREALPDLRRRAAEGRDPDGAITAAIRKIEAFPR